MTFTYRLLALLAALGTTAAARAQESFPSSPLPPGESGSGAGPLAATNGYVVAAVVLAWLAIVLALLLRRRPEQG